MAGAAAPAENVSPDLTGFVDAFAAPSGDATAASIAMVAEAFQDQVLADLGDALGRQAVPELEAWLRSGRTYDRDDALRLDPVFSIARCVLLAGRDPVGIGAELALMMAPPEGTACTVRLATPVRLRWGTTILPATTTLALCRAEGRTRLGLSDGSLWIRPTPGDRAIALAGGAGATELLGAAAGFGTIAIINQDVGPGVLTGGVDRDIAPALGGSAIIVCGALDRLGALAPAYLDWVGAVVSIVLLTRGDGDSLNSGSNPGWGGAVRIGAHPCWEALAEMLVHEASHQYLYLLDMLGIPLVEEGATEAFSPLKGMPRPMAKLLLGYHAFANIALMYRSVLAGAGGSRFGAASLARVLRDLDALREPLAAPGVLTPLGTTLFRRLEQSLAA